MKVFTIAFIFGTISLMKLSELSDYEKEITIICYILIAAEIWVLMERS